MIFVRAIAVVLALNCGSAMAAAVSGASQIVAAQLCAGGIEGSYTAVINGSFSRLNLICLDTQTLAATMVQFTGPAEKSTLMNRWDFPYYFIDDNRLMISTTPLDAADRGTLPSDATFTYLEIPLSSLQRIGFSAGLQTQMLGAEEPAAFVRDASVVFPAVTPATGGPFPEDTVRGSYKVATSFLGPLTIDFNIFDHVPYITMQIPATGNAQHMVFGPAFDPARGLISSLGVAGNMNAAVFPYYYMRGRFLTAASFEFYIIDSNGIYGPYTASK